MFCATETAFIGLQRLRLKHLVQTGRRDALVVEKIMARPERFLATVLLGINFFETAMATLGTVIALQLWGQDLGAAIATVIITITTLVVAEVIPKTLAARRGEAIALKLAPMVNAVSLALFPFVWILSRIGLGLQKLGGEEPADRPTLSADEMRTAIMVGEAEGVLKEEEADMLHEIFRFRDRMLRDIVTTRTEVHWVEKGTKVVDFIASYAEHPHSRFPVYEGDTDNVVGVLSIKDVLVAQATNACDGDATIDGLIRPAYFVPATKRLGDLLSEMREGNRHMAIAISEYGGVAGIVTMDQLVSEIVGEIRDELAHDEADIVTIDERTFRVDGNIRIEDANEELSLGLPNGPYSTLAGFIMGHLGRIPREGESLKYRNLRFTVSKMQGLKVEEIMITKERDAATAG